MVIRMVIRMVSRMVIRMVSRMVILWLYGVLEGPQCAFGFIATEKVIAREDGYSYIAALRSPDLRHTTKREGDTSVIVVTSNV